MDNNAPLPATITKAICFHLRDTFECLQCKKDTPQPTTTPSTLDYSVIGGLTSNLPLSSRVMSGMCYAFGGNVQPAPSSNAPTPSK